MNIVEDITLRPAQAAYWHLGQAGALLRSAGVTVVVDPYLSDSVAAIAPDCARLLPVPIAPDALRADVFLVTHDHLDHLDPETIRPYRFKAQTAFVAPRLAIRTLAALGVPDASLHRVDVGDTVTVSGVTIRGMHAEPTEDAVADTTGYHLTFPNGRTLYHTADTGFSDALLASARFAEVLLVCINGKWGNLAVEEAVRLAGAVGPLTAIPNHYDMMAPNREDPQRFVSVLHAAMPEIRAHVPELMRPFVWGTA